MFSSRVSLRFTAVWLVACSVRAVTAQDAVLPPGDNTPILRLETGGPRSYVSGLAFSRDGKTLYVSGWDKAVLVWNQGADGRFEFSPRAALRVPTGAGLYGGLNGLALSPDGQWLAAGGQGYASGISGQRESGWIVPAGILDIGSQLQQGLIYVFNTADRTTRLLRGHRGPVQAVAFVRGASAQAPLLVSVAEERSDESSDYRPVIRFWNVATATQVAVLSSFSSAANRKGDSLPSLQGFRPGLAAWSYGDKPSQTRIALGWGDDQFRIWDVGTGQVASAANSQNVLSVLPLDDQATRLFTGAHALVGSWQIDGGKSALKKEQFTPGSVSSVNGKAKNLAGAAVLIPAKAGGPKIACLVTRYLEDGQGEYRLLLLDSAKPLKLLKEISLPWKGGIRQTALAASPDGSRLALAGSDRDEIEMHLVADLLDGRGDRGQILSSAGVIFSDAEFVQSEGSLGLKLTPSTISRGAQLVADFKNRAITSAADRWSSARADAQGWSIKPTAPGKLRVDGPGAKNVELTLDPGYSATCQAIVPATKICPVPLAAVGSQFRGQPRLQLFNAATGEQLRWCVGHTEQLNSVSFSADGRMLVSTADDRVVSVWTLTDLAERTIGQHGRIAGLIVDSKNDRLTVRTPPAAVALTAGDEIVGLTRGRETIGARTPREFYEYVLDLSPGTSIDITVRRGNSTQTVTCPVVQAIDEVKPLFSIFISPAANGREWQWIGWHPLGNFDSRGDDVDRWLGWQFNTGDRERPARYAAIGDYRDTFYRRDLLSQLIDNQKLVAAEVVEDPRLSIWLEDADGNVLSNQGDALPRVTSGKLRIHAEVTGVPAKSVQSLDAFLDDAQVATLQPTTEGQWTGDLSQAAWSRGRRRVSVRLKTKSRELTQLIRLNFAPAAPRLQWQPGWNPKDELKTSDLVVEAAIQPSTEPFEARLVLHRPGTAEPAVLKTWAGREPLTIKEPLSIAPGENRVELEVWNAGVPASDRANESARQISIVRRAIPEAPVIQIDSVFSVAADGKQSPVEPDQLVYKSNQPQFRIQGRIDATDNLTAASLEAAATRRDLAGFQPGTARQLAFNELITLEPGKTDVVLRSSVGDRAAERRISLAWLPQTPTIREFKADVTTIKKVPDSIAGYLDNVLFEGYHEPSVVLTARLEGNLAQPYSLELLANDQKVDAAQLEINRSNPAEHVVTIRLPLQGGRQSFSLKATNAWSAEDSQKQVDLEFRRPPSITQIEIPERLAGTPLDFRARVHSTLPLRAARLTVDDSIEVPNVRLEPIEGTPNSWLVSAAKIGLAEGEHQLQLTVANDDGLSLEPMERSLKMDRPPVAAPTLAITEPSTRDASLTVASPRLEIEYRAESKAPVGIQIEIRGNAQKLEQNQITIPAAEVKDGVLVDRQPIELFEGVNEITLQAHNEGGFSEKVVLRVSYVPTAATVEIVSLGDLKPQVRNDGTGYFGQAAQKSYLPLKGRVKLNDPAMAKRQMSARIWVNNFKLPTVPVAFDESQPGVGTFSTDVVFNKSNDNVIHVEVFTSDGRVASELGCTNELLIDCQKPDQKQELYLLLLGTGNGDEIRDKARESLQAKALTTQQASQEVWTNAAFSRIYVHDAMNVPPAAVQNRLRELIGKMHNNLRSGQQSNLQSVVMVLFQGKITLQAEDFSLTTAATAGTRALTGHVLEEYLTRTYGAHLILLDLVDSEQGLRNKDIWPKAPHLGIELFSWYGKGNKPENLSLITMLGESLPRSRLVRDLADDLDRRVQVAENEYPGQIENVNLLKDVYDLRIGGGQ